MKYDFITPNDINKIAVEFVNRLYYFDNSSEQLHEVVKFIRILNPIEGSKLDSYFESLSPNEKYDKVSEIFWYGLYFTIPDTITQEQLYRMVRQIYREFPYLYSPKKLLDYFNDSTDIKISESMKDIIDQISKIKESLHAKEDKKWGFLEKVKNAWEFTKIRIAMLFQ